MLVSNKKGDGVPIAILLLVLATITLTTFTLFVMIQRNNQISGDIYSSKIFEDLTAREKLIDFYLQDLVSNSAKNAGSVEIFINNFNSNLDYYRDQNGKYLFGELEQFKGKLAEKDVSLVNGKFSIGIPIKIDSKFYNKKGEKVFELSREYISYFESA
ncbi:MAG: hypothetical protein WC781_02900 [Candidatus Pacearchaeota archaeon]|jgi:hypothetical protein